MNQVTSLVICTRACPKNIIPESTDYMNKRATLLGPGARPLNNIAPTCQGSGGE